MPKDASKLGHRGIGFVTFASPDSVEKVPLRGCDWELVAGCPLCWPHARQALWPSRYSRPAVHAMSHADESRPGVLRLVGAGDGDVAHPGGAGAGDRPRHTKGPLTARWRRHGLWCRQPSWCAPVSR